MFAELAGGIAVSFVASLLGCGFLVRTGPRDNPTEPRKAHAIPTPTSGGLGIALGFALGLVFAVRDEGAWRASLDTLEAGEILILAGVAFAMLLIGFIDDALRLPALPKGVLFCAAAISGAFTAGVVTELPLTFSFSLSLTFALGLFGSAMWVFTLVNCVNFMDGANGLAMGSVAIGLATLAGLGWEIGAPLVTLVSACCVGGLLGFLIWNFPNGRLFAGDSGALFAASIAALASLVLVTQGGVSPFVPPIVFFPLLGDALLTLLWRARRGRPLLVAHSEHLYQIALRAWPGHWRATTAYWVVSAACGVIAHFVSREADPAAPWIALASLALLSIIISAFMRSWAVARGYLAP